MRLPLRVSTPTNRPVEATLLGDTLVPSKKTESILSARSCLHGNQSGAEKGSERVQVTLTPQVGDWALVTPLKKPELGGVPR